MQTSELTAIFVLPRSASVSTPADTRITVPWCRINLARCPALQERFPDYDVAMGPDSKPVPMIDMAKTESELGLRLTPLKETLQDMAVTLVNLGVAKPKRKAGATNGTA